MSLNLSSHNSRPCTRKTVTTFIIHHCTTTAFDMSACKNLIYLRKKKKVHSLYGSIRKEVRSATLFCHHATAGKYSSSARNPMPPTQPSTFHYGSNYTGRLRYICHTTSLRNLFNLSLNFNVILYESSIR